MWKQKFLMALSFLLSVICARHSLAFEMRLEVGESQILDSEDGVELNFSRKGVVDATSRSRTSWQITALKAGFVLLKRKREGVMIDSIPIFVQKAKEEMEAQSPLETLSAICKSSRFSCNFESNIITGETDDYRQFFQAKRLSCQLKNILFTAKLSEIARDQARKDLGEGLGIGDPFEITALGEIVFFTPCVENEAKSLQQMRNSLPQLAPYFDKASVQCRPFNEDDFHLLEAKVLLSKDLTSEDWDFFKQLNNQLEKQRRLEIFMKENKVELLAEPLFLLSESKEASVVSGGEVEIQAFEGARDKEQVLARVASWKEYGFRMQVKLKRQSQKAAILEFSFSIKQPQQSGHYNNLNSNSVQSEVLLHLGQQKIVACVELGSNGEHQMTVPLLSKTPIIAPFFTARSMNKSISKVLVSLCWREDKGSSLQLKK